MQKVFTLSRVWQPVTNWLKKNGGHSNLWTAPTSTTGLYLTTNSGLVLMYDPGRQGDRERASLWKISCFQPRDTAVRITALRHKRVWPNFLDWSDNKRCTPCPIQSGHLPKSCNTETETQGQIIWISLLRVWIFLSNHFVAQIKFYYKIRGTGKFGLVHAMKAYGGVKVQFNSLRPSHFTPG